MTDLPTITFEAKKDSFRQLQDGGVKVGLTVHPNDLVSLIPFIQAHAGQRFQCVLVAIGDDEQPVEVGNKVIECDEEKLTEVLSTVATRNADVISRRFAEMSRAQQAGMLCNEPDFWKWFGERQLPPRIIADASDCAVRLRDILGVASRADIDRDVPNFWDSILTDYRQAVGQEAEARG